MDEVKAYLGGAFVKEKDWEETLDKVDSNRNGKIDFWEFNRFFQNMKEEDNKRKQIILGHQGTGIAAPEEHGLQKKL